MHKIMMAAFVALTVAPGEPSGMRRSRRQSRKARLRRAFSICRSAAWMISQSAL